MLSLVSAGIHLVISCELCGHYKCCFFVTEDTLF